MRRIYPNFVHPEEDAFEITEDVEGVRDTVLMCACHYVADGEDLVTTMQRAVPKRRTSANAY